MSQRSCGALSWQMEPACFRGRPGGGLEQCVGDWGGPGLRTDVAEAALLSQRECCVVSSFSATWKSADAPFSQVSAAVRPCSRHAHLAGQWSDLCSRARPLLMFTRRTLVLEVSTHCGVAAV